MVLLFVLLLTPPHCLNTSNKLSQVNMIQHLEFCLKYFLLSLPLRRSTVICCLSHFVCTNLNISENSCLYWNCISTINSRTFSAISKHDDKSRSKLCHYRERDTVMANTISIENMKTINLGVVKHIRIWRDFYEVLASPSISKV